MAQVGMMRATVTAEAGGWGGGGRQQKWHKWAEDWTERVHETESEVTLGRFPGPSPGHGSRWDLYTPRGKTGGGAGGRGNNFDWDEWHQKFSGPPWLAS